MTRPKLRLVVLGLGTAAMLALVAAAETSPPRPKPGINIPPPKRSPTPAHWVPMVDYDALEIKPRPLEQAPPLFPPGLKEAGAKAKVAVELVINKQGNVEHAQILSSTDPRFNDACIAAAKQWRFTVPKSRGEPVYCRVSQNLSFD